MKINALLLGMLFLLASLLGGCANKTVEIVPPEIVYGQEVCSRCGMSIDDVRFASATLLADGTYLKFDDAGEMVLYHLVHDETEVLAWFVHDYNTSEWLRGEEAYFVLANNLITPMGTGVVAFATAQDAEQFAAANSSSVYNLKDLMNLLKTQ